MKLCKMIEIYIKYDSMHTTGVINAFICIKNHVNSCIKCMLSLIELVGENSHHHPAKSFEGRSTTSKGGMLDAKAVETGIVLDKIEKLTEAQNLIMDSLKIRSSFDGLAPLAHSNASPC